MSHWSYVHRVINQIEAERGVNIKSFDNKYHIAVKVGNSPTAMRHKYSQACVDFLDNVRNGREYNLDVMSVSMPAS